jgi:uncharacterized NAD(P)/FAD-binding protein YdhS
LNDSVPKAIVIVGGGASATLLLAQLSIQLNTHLPINIYLIDDNEGFKTGLAYSIEHPSFILNVDADRMGAWSDKPNDFYHWLNNYPQLWRNLHPDFLTVNYHADNFVPRMIYGAYLRWVFDSAVIAAAEKNIRIHRISARVSSIDAIKYNSTLLVKTDTHESIRANAVVIATGNSSIRHSQLNDKNIFTSPYQQNFIWQDWNAIKNIIIVGSGLSMVDAVQYLAHQNYQGNIQIFSRHGLLPLPHVTPAPCQECPTFNFVGLNNAKKIVGAVRAQIFRNNKQGICWQTTINSLRTHANHAWLTLPIKEREKLRRVLPWWNIARHRIPITAYELLVNLQQEGRLTINKGEVKHAESDGEYFLLNLHQKTAFIKADKMLICSGYLYNQSLKKLCGGLLDHETSHLLEDYRLSKHYALHAIGPALGNLLFETTAIHEIRQQSLNIAAKISRQLQTHKQAMHIS